MNEPAINTGNTGLERTSIYDITFEHGTNDGYEFYFHTDRNGVIWQVWRYLREPYQTGWYASVHQPGPGGVDAVLNDLIHQRADIPYSAEMSGDQKPSLLLRRIAQLIKTGQLPQYESFLAKVDPPQGNIVNAPELDVFYVSCRVCRKLYALKIEKADYYRYVDKTELIQYLFPYLVPPMRELLISGTCPKCWKQMFGAEDTSAETHGSDLNGESAVMAFTQTDTKQSSGHTAWKMSELCRAGDCSECVTYFSDESVDYRCACDCHGWELDDESDCY